MAFPVPNQHIGGDFAEPLPKDNQELLVKRLNERFAALQENQDAWVTAFPLGPALLQPGAVQFDQGSTLSLTTSPQDVPGVSVITPIAGTYLFLAIFNFAVTVAGAGICVGAVRRVTGGSFLSGQAQYGPDGYGAGVTGDATVAQINMVDAVKGEEFRLSAYKSAGGGTAQAFGGETRLLMLGPIGPVS